jgi:hypothetical protein
MALPLTILDFKLRQATCELRYPDAFLIFDKTGDIYHELGKKFTNLKSDAATPAQTQMTADEGVISVEQQILRLTDNDPDLVLEKFAPNFKTLFDCVVDRLDLVAFTRIGLRQLFFKSYESAQQSEAALNALRLVQTGAEKRFGAGPNIAELFIRWEDKELGAVFRIKAEKGSLDAKFPFELGMAEKSIHKEFHRLVMDIDYYTIATVERDQWDPVTWITQSARIVRKEADRFLSL